MKLFALPLLALFAPVVMNAAVHTVSNTPGSPAQYNSLQAAHDAASPGDTLMIQVSADVYGQLNMDRQLTLIGGGHTNPGTETNISGIYLYPGSDGSKFIGLYVANQLYLNYGGPASNMLVERCQVGTIYFGGDGLIIKHSYFGNCYLGGGTNVLITNNFINGGVSSSTYPSVLISNNVFANNNSSYGLSSMQFAVISNNIFYGLAPSIDGAGVENCAFNNNISYGTVDDNLPPTGSNVGTGNLEGVDPQFVNVADFLVDNVAYDYHLQAGSSGVNAGTDGTDIGLYGGGDPLLVPYDGVPRIPLITTFNLLNSSISEGGSINVQVEATKHD